MKKRLLFVILAFHAAILLGLTCFEIISPVQNKKTQLEINTLIVQSGQRESKKTSAQTASTFSSPPIPSQSKKRPAKNVKKTVKKTIPPVKPTQIAHTKEVEKLLEDALQHLDSYSKKAPEFVKIEKLNCETIHDVPHEYALILRSFLQETLCFPEPGEVKVSLTIKEDGHIVHFAILTATNEANRKYVETTLPKLILPWPQTEETLLLTLTDSPKILSKDDPS